MNYRRYNCKNFGRSLGISLLLTNAFVFCVSIPLTTTSDFHQNSYFYRLIIWASCNLLISIIISIYHLICRCHESHFLSYPSQESLSTPVDSTSDSSTGDEDTLCLICQRHLNPEKGEVIITSCCQHLLHAECQVKWLNKQDLCPFPYCERTIINFDKI